MPAGAATITAEERPLLAAARKGDEDAFGRLVAPYRGELHAHAYRMLGSIHDAEDALQDALLRAWRGLARFEGRSTLRSWLYTITTNTSLNAIPGAPSGSCRSTTPPLPTRTTGRGAGGGNGVDGALRRRKFGLQDGLAGPEARYEQRESVELAFIAALQHLPANQRAVLILRDVLGFSAKETAEALETTVASANSALQRARETVEERLPEQSQQATLRALGDERVQRARRQLHGGVGSCDVDAVVGMLTEDATLRDAPAGDLVRRPRPRSRPSSSGSPMSGMWQLESVLRALQRTGGAGLLQLGRRRGHLRALRAQRPHLPRRAYQRRHRVHHHDAAPNPRP